MSSKLCSVNVLKNGISISEKITIQKINGKDENIYKSIIEDINENSIDVVLPMHQGVMMFPSLDDEYTVNLYTDFGILQFICNYVSHRMAPLGVLKISYPINVYKIQRRNHVRIGEHLDISLVRKEKNTEFSAITKNISAGGMLISTKEEFMLNEEINLNINIPIVDHKTSYKISVKDLKIERITVPCKILRIDSFHQETKIYNYGIQFTNIYEQYRYVIMRYIFYRQTQKRQLMCV